MRAIDVPATAGFAGMASSYKHAMRAIVMLHYRRFRRRAHAKRQMIGVATALKCRRPCVVAAQADVRVVLAKGRYSEGGLCTSLRRASGQARGSALTKHNVTPIVRPFESSLA